MTTRMRVTLGVGALALVIGCTSKDDDPGMGMAGGTGAGGAGGAGMMTTGALPPTPVKISAACMGGPKAGPAYMRRLTNREYTRTVRALLGTTEDAAEVFALPPDVNTEGYDNNQASLTMSWTHAERYRAAAEGLAAQVMDMPAKRTAVMGCDVAASPDCLTSFVQTFGSRAFRRPLEAEEATRLVQLASGATDPVIGARRVLQAILQSPHFLFRIEVGAPDPAKPGLNKLSGYEIAARLSYLLWMAPPNEQLLMLAANKQLDTDTGVANQARLMMNDSKAQEAMRHFTNQWLRLYDVEHVTRPTDLYPDWNDAVKVSMRTETERVVSDFIWPSNANLLDMLTANYTWVDKALGKIYNLPQPATGFARTAVSMEKHRRTGVLTHSSVLTLAALGSEVVAPILRGKFVREVLLCTPPPLPPAEVPSIDATPKNASVRNRLAQHRKDPACAACHQLLEPLGFAFEEYDLMGRWRTKDGTGAAVTGDAELLLEGYDLFKFSGPLPLAQRIQSLPETPSCVATHFHRFSLGREELEADKCTIEHGAAFLQKNNNNLRSFLLWFVGTDAFRYVAPGGLPDSGGEK